MILIPDNEFCVVVDACVLLPMPLCDTLLRAAEDPSFFRIVWSEEILNEVRRGLVSEKFGYSTEQAERRIQAMRATFTFVEFRPQCGDVQIGDCLKKETRQVADRLLGRLARGASKD